MDYIYAKTLNELMGAAGRVDLDIQCFHHVQYVIQAIFVIYRY